MEWGFVSVDGSKFFACNSRNNNFTKSKLDDRIKWLDSRVEEYMRILDETDSIDELKDDPEKLTKEFVEQRLEELKERFYYGL